MTSIGIRGAGASRNAGGACLAHRDAVSRARVDLVARPSAGTVRLAITTQDDGLAGAIASMSAVADVEMTRLAGPDECSRLTRRTMPLDVIVLDHPSTADILRRIRILRVQWPMCGIIVLNVPTVQECASLLNEGADDACTQSSRLVVERLHALMRRARTLNAGLRLAVGDVIIDREHRRVWCAGHEVGLTVKEFDVLLCLFDRFPNAVSKPDLGMIVWHADPLPSQNVVEVYVGYVRRKLAGSRVVRISTIRGTGYVLRGA